MSHAHLVKCNGQKQGGQDKDASGQKRLLIGGSRFLLGQSCLLYTSCMAVGVHKTGSDGASGGIDDLAVLRHLSHLADLYDLSVVDQDIAGLLIHTGHGD